MKGIQRFRRPALVAALAGLGAAGGCDSIDKLLEANNPEAITDEELNDAQLADVLVNSAKGELRDAYDDRFIWRGSMLTDEQVTGINWEQTARLNERIVPFNEADALDMFRFLSAARQMADSASGRLRNLLENPNQDARLATTLAYAGYGYILLGDAMCEATVNLGPELYEPLDLYEIAVTKLEEAVQIAQAAGGEEGIAIANLARVGLARAHLNLGNKAEVQQWASQVPEEFVWWVEYGINAEDDENILFTRVTGGNHALGVHPRFLNGAFGTQDIIASQTDPRIQHTKDWTHGHNQLTQLYTPYQSLPYSGFNGETIASGGEPILYERETDIKLADGLEARHHLAEAEGPTAATLAFVNERRAFGSQPPVNLSGEALMSELREQRSRDLYLGGFRLGDLRRYERQGINDPKHSFPTGQHANAQWGQYEDATCFPLPKEEYEANPHLPLP